MQGGSNYISIGANLDSTMLFGAFKNNQSTIEQQMSDMIAAGQQWITFVVWFSDLKADGFPDDPHGYRMSSNGGQLSSQNHDSILGVISLAENVGFQKIHFRFAPQGPASPDNWNNGFQQAVFEENASFILNVRNLVVQNVSVPVLFDLSLESISSGPFWMQYNTGLWKTYTSQFGNGDACISLSCGRNATIAKNRIQLFKQFKQQRLPLPAFYLVDCYSNEYAKLQALASGMKSIRVVRPIYIQECWYNDPATAAQFAKAKNIPGLKILGVFQWPNNRTDGTGDFNHPFPQDFGNYKSV